jgi:transposase-like protein
MFIAVDGTHTRSKYRTQLIIVVGIDANNNGVPVAWALVPIEDEYWWTWFFEQLYIAMPNSRRRGQIFMSDREKGIPLALEKVYPLATHAYCCQHIADNVQTNFGNACRPLFWACARAKTKVQFHKALKALFKQNNEAGEYIDDIPHEYWAWYTFPRPRYG